MIIFYILLESFWCAIVESDTDKIRIAQSAAVVQENWSWNRLLLLYLLHRRPIGPMQSRATQWHEISFVQLVAAGEWLTTKSQLEGNAGEVSYGIVSSFCYEQTQNSSPSTSSSSSRRPAANNGIRQQTFTTFLLSVSARVPCEVIK